MKLDSSDAAKQNRIADQIFQSDDTPVNYNMGTREIQRLIKGENLGPSPKKAKKEIETWEDAEAAIENLMKIGKEAQGNKLEDIPEVKETKQAILPPGLQSRKAILKE